MAAAVGRAEAIFRAPPTEDGERHTTLCAGVAQVLGSVARGWRAAAAEDERQRAARREAGAAGARRGLRLRFEEDEDEAGAVVASHPLLGVAPPARKRRPGRRGAGGRRAPGRGRGRRGRGPDGSASSSATPLVVVGLGFRRSDDDARGGAALARQLLFDRHVAAAAAGVRAY